MSGAFGHAGGYSLMDLEDAFGPEAVAEEMEGDD